MKNRHKKIIQHKGFTLIELIVVMAIIGILVLLAAPRFLGRTRDALYTQIINDISRAETKVDEYLIEHERLDGWDSSVDTTHLNELVDNDELYSRRGIVKNDLPSNDYSQLPDDFVKQTVRSALDGAFYSDEEGNVYYHHENNGQLGSGGNTGDSEDDWLPAPDVPEDYDVTLDWNGVPDGSDGDYPEWTEQNLFEYEIISNNYARITGYYGANSANDFREELDVVIPETITHSGNEYPVRVIGEYAFMLSQNAPISGSSAVFTPLKTVHIPNTVIEVEATAFFNLGNITEAVYLGKNIEKIGNMAFSMTGFENLVTTESLVELGEAAFGNGPSQLRNLNMHYSVALKELPPELTNASNNIRELYLPPNLEVIHDRALANIIVSEVTIPESVHTIGDMPFGSGNLSLIEQINIKDINAIQFMNYGVPRESRDDVVTALNSLLSFSGQTGILHFEQPFRFDEDSQTITHYWHEGHDREVVIPGEINGVIVRRLGPDSLYKYNIGRWQQEFLNIPYIDKITIPESIEVIESRAFTDYSTADGQFKDGIVFEGERIKHINAETFFGAATRHFWLPNSVESIHGSAFTMTHLESINIPHSLVVIPDGFMTQKSPDRQNLNDVIITEENTQLEVIGRGAFSGTHISEFYIPENVREIGSYAFAETNLSEITIPDSVQVIGEMAFIDTSISEVTIPSHTDVHEDAFDEDVVINRR